MEKFKLNRQGYLTHWLISGPLETPFNEEEPSEKWNNQLEYEAHLRGKFQHNGNKMPPVQVKLNEMSPLNKPWRYYYDYENWFVDVSDFYSLLTRVDLLAASGLFCEKECEIEAFLWTYADVEIWLNAELIANAGKPVYKPIKRQKINLKLKKGLNEIYVRMGNIGVRDTRNIFGLQLLRADGVLVQMPDAENLHELTLAESWLAKLYCSDGKLHVPPEKPPCEIKLCMAGETSLLAVFNIHEIKVKGSELIVTAFCKQQKLSRSFELLEKVLPLKKAAEEEHHKAFYNKLAKTLRQPRATGIFFSVFHVLARYATGATTPEDEGLLLEDLNLIEKRVDCSDFLVIGFIRLLKNYSVSEKLGKRIKEVLLGFRYWMDENGSDGMCFWSENHALMFHGSQMVIGEMYAEDIFWRSGRSGAQQFDAGAARCREWLADVEKDGVEEFNSASYMPVTIAALLNLVDFAPKDIAKRAFTVIDVLVRQLALHIFKQSSISPQGRVYRDVIYPYKQTTQSLLNFMLPAYPYADKESMWNVCFATSNYVFPQDIAQIAQQEQDTSYVSGNARVVLRKTKGYILTSVASPRAKTDEPVWENLCFVKDADKNTNAYVKSLNERFHGTSVFKPGVYGYQQHLWYAALSSQAIVFVNHPASSTDMDKMRPGYWYGNGIFPAVKQKSSELAAVYNIAKEHPICFTHVFWPEVKFDETIAQSNWLFGRVKNVYLALWCSGKLEKMQLVLTNCEYRCYDEKTAYYCICGDEAEYKNFESFMFECKAKPFSFEKKEGTFTFADGETVQFIKNTNKTQII